MYFSKVNLQRKAEFLVLFVLEMLPLTLKLQSSSVRQRAGLGTLGYGLPSCVEFVSVSLELSPGCAEVIITSEK